MFLLGSRHDPFFLPGCAAGEDGVGEDDQFAGTGDDGSGVGFAVSDEAAAKAAMKAV
jgi:hypothetical protein